MLNNNNKTARAFYFIIIIIAFFVLFFRFTTVNEIERVGQIIIIYSASMYIIDLKYRETFNVINYS